MQMNVTDTWGAEIVDMAQGSAQAKHVQAEYERWSRAKEAEIKAVTDGVRAANRSEPLATEQRKIDAITREIGVVSMAVASAMAREAEAKSNRERIGGGGALSTEKRAAFTLPSIREYREFESKGLSIGVDPDGGYLTQTEIGPLFAYLKPKSIVLQANPRVFTMTQDRMELPKLTASSTVYAVAENGTVTASSPTFGRVALTARAYAVRVLGSAEWFDDANPEPRQLLSDDIRDRIALKYDLDCLEGDGTSSKPITGLRNLTGITQTEVAAGAGAGGAVALNDFVNAIDRLRRDNANPTFIAMHPRTWGSVQKLLDGQSRPMLQPDPTQDASLRLFGLPVLLSSQISITETLGASTDCSYIVIGDAQQLAVGFRTQNAVVYNPYSYASTRQVEVVHSSRLAFNVLNTEAVEIIEGVRAV